MSNLKNLIFLFLVLIATQIGLAQTKSIDYPVLIQKIDPLNISFEMVQVPGVIYKMGLSESDSIQPMDQGPEHLVQIDSLWVGKYEVTWELFELFLDKNKNIFDAIPQEKSMKVDAITRPSPPFEDPSFGMGKTGFPVISISPYAAISFSKWLTAITGRFYRLPTEAEWEYICKGGSSNDDFFADKIDNLGQYAWTYENSDYQYAKVGQLQPNAFGIYDILGNVAEWTLDYYEEDFYSAEKDSIAKNPWNIPRKLHPRVYRGGSFDDDAVDVSSIKRGVSGLYLQKNDPQIPKSFWWYTDAAFIGFRIVSPVKQPSENELKKFWQIVLDE